MADKRSEHVSARVTARQLATIDRLAEERQVTRSTVVYQLLLESPLPVYERVFFGNSARQKSHRENEDRQ